MRITVLGKSPAWQDVDGACTGYLVEGGGQVILLDCGPGVFAKLRKHVAYESIDAIVISGLRTFFTLRMAWKSTQTDGPDYHHENLREIMSDLSEKKTDFG